MCFIRGENNLEIMFFTFGVLVVTVLKMLTRTRKRVTRSAILPGMTSIGMRKEIQETITNSPVHYWIWKQSSMAMVA